MKLIDIKKYKKGSTIRVGFMSGDIEVARNQMMKVAELLLEEGAILVINMNDGKLTFKHKGRDVELKILNFNIGLRSTLLSMIFIDKDLINLPNFNVVYNKVIQPHLSNCYIKNKHKSMVTSKLTILY